MARNTWALIAIIVCVIILIVALILIFFGLTRKNSPGPPCSSNNQCNPTQQCTDGHCVQIACSVNSDCGPSQICSNGFCYQNQCITTAGCGTGTVCQNGLCFPYGQGCSNNQDCSGGSLPCVAGICSQCAADEDCTDGVCGGDGICHNTCTHVIGACGTGTSCVNDFCCPAGTYPSTCSQPGACGAGFCVNGACTCSKGEYGNTCVSPTDCDSGICLGGICVNTGDNCYYNFNSSVSGPAHCSSGAPYCSNGSCSTQSLGAPCTCFEFNSGATATCPQYQACNLGLTGGTAAVSTTYCVNGTCSLTPGWVGASCTSSFDCAPISGAPNCNNGRCT